MALNLTAGAICMLSGEEWNTVGLKPVLQVMDIRIMPSTVTEPVSCRFLLSDCTFQQQGRLATLLNDLVWTRQLKKGSIVQLNDFVCNRSDRFVIKVVELNVIRSECDIIGDPKTFPINLPGIVIPSSRRDIPPVLRPTYSSLNEPRMGSGYNFETATFNEESEEFFNNPYSKRSRTSPIDETFADDSFRYSLGPPASYLNIDLGVTTGKLNNLEQDMKKAVANPDEMKKRAPTVDECYNKLKGLGLKATNPMFLAAFVIFSQPDNCRESWMTLPSDPGVLKSWIVMMAKSLDITI